MNRATNKNRWRQNASRVAFIDLFLSSLGLLYCGYLLYLTVKETNRRGYYGSDETIILWARNISATLLQFLAVFTAYSLLKTTDDDTESRKALSYATLYRNVNWALLFIPFICILEFLQGCVSDKRYCNGFGFLILKIVISVIIRSIYLYVVHNYIKELKFLIEQSSGNFDSSCHIMEVGDPKDNALSDKNIES